MNTSTVPAYVVGLIADVQINEELFDYMEAVETSMRRFRGRWISHGRTPEIREGELPGDVVIIEFPDLATAHAWYDSDEYQAIIPLRTHNSRAVVAITEGVCEPTTRPTRPSGACVVSPPHESPPRGGGLVRGRPVTTTVK